MTRDELYMLVWSRPVSQVAPEVGLSDTGLAKACRRHGVMPPPRGYWAQFAAGMAVERAPAPIDGQTETGVRLVGVSLAVSEHHSSVLEQGLRRALHDAAIEYLDLLTGALPTYPEPTATIAAHWIAQTRGVLAKAGPAADVSDLLVASGTRRPANCPAWLVEVVRAR